MVLKPLKGRIRVGALSQWLCCCLGHCVMCYTVSCLGVGLSSTSGEPAGHTHPVKQQAVAQGARFTQGTQFLAFSLGLAQPWLLVAFGEWVEYASWSLEVNLSNR